jgi:hypothetical protein
MFNDAAAEFLELEHYSLNSIDYKPFYDESLDKRRTAGARSSIARWDIGTNGHQGNNRSPIFKMIFADIENITAGYIKVWAIDNDNIDGVIFRKAYLQSNPELMVYLNKFEFTDAAGTPVAPGAAYTIIGCKKKGMPLNY